MSEDAKAPVSVVRTGREEHVLRLDAEEPKDPWDREGANTLARFHAEKAVREYAAAKTWGAIRFRHVGELVREVPVALWSVTVRDLIAEAVIVVGLDMVTNYTVTSGGKIQKSRLDFQTANPDALPSVVRGVAATTPRQAEARAMLTDVARFLADPPRRGVGEPVLFLDEMAQRAARKTGRKLDSVRADLDERAGKKAGALAREARRQRARAKAGPKKPLR